MDQRSGRMATTAGEPIAAKVIMLPSVSRHAMRCFRRLFCCSLLRRPYAVVLAIRGHHVLTAFKGICRAWPYAPCPGETQRRLAILRTSHDRHTDANFVHGEDWCNELSIVIHTTYSGVSVMPCVVLAACRTFFLPTPTARTNGPLPQIASTNQRQWSHRRTDSAQRACPFWTIGGTIQHGQPSDSCPVKSCALEV